ncbi:hypothetical protein BSG01_018 [Bacillus phage BSG01]|nr:hypothetical protein BSG01_018 [Bacillus phage BSG01]
MEINFTDEQIEKMIKKKAEEMIQQKINTVIKVKIDKVLKDNYRSSQDLKEEIDRAIQNILEERLNVLISDEKLRNMVNRPKIAEIVANKLLEVVNETLVDSVNDLFN